MRLFTMSGPLVQQPYTVTAYPNVYFYLLGTLADWPLAGDCALDKSFDKNGKISILCGGLEIIICRYVRVLLLSSI